MSRSPRSDGSSGTNTPHVPQAHTPSKVLTDSATQSNYEQELQALAAKALASSASGAAGAKFVDKLLITAATLPADQLKKYVRNVRKRNPEASPEQIVNILSAHFRNVLSSTGGAVGAAAAFPGIGTTAALALTGADLAAFFATASIYSLAVAEVYGVSTSDPERRKAFVLATVLGDSGATTVSTLGAVPMARWGKSLMTSMPTSTIRQVNKVLRSKFMKRSLAKHSGLALGRIVPFGIGAAVGFTGGRVLANTVISQAKTAFGTPPTHFNDTVIEARIIP